MCQQSFIYLLNIIFARNIKLFMKRDILFPDYIFESSWEVCNKVGGIYTVLSTRAKTLVEQLGDKLIFIGPGEKKTTNTSQKTTNSSLHGERKLKQKA